MPNLSDTHLELPARVVQDVKKTNQKTDPPTRCLQMRKTRISTKKKTLAWHAPHERCAIGTYWHAVSGPIASRLGLDGVVKSA